MKKSSITLVRISAVFAVSSVCIVAEHVYFRLIEDSNNTDNCSDYVGSVGTAVTAAKCGADCSRNGQCRGFLYDHVTTVCKDVYRDNIVDPECQADGGADYYSEVCDRFLVSGPYGVPDSQLDESSNYCSVYRPRYCPMKWPKPPLSVLHARLNSIGRYNGGWNAAYQNKYQYVQVDFLKPKTVTRVYMQSRYKVGWAMIQYIKSFKLLHSDDCSTYEALKDGNGDTLILEGNNNTRDTIVRDLPRRVKARCFRINPVTWQGAISLRFDLMGCP